MHVPTKTLVLVGGALLAATVDVTGPQDRSLRLAASGEVCGTWPDATYVVTHSFVGR